MIALGCVNDAVPHINTWLEYYNSYYYYYYYYYFYSRAETQTLQRTNRMIALGYVIDPVAQTKNTH